MNAPTKSILFSLLFLLTTLTSTSQPILAQYIAEAFAQNLVIKEKKVALDKSLLAIKEARSLFLPVTWFESQYTLAKGGRSIDIPIGDLLNPVYRTLNQLTSSNSFPVVRNVKEQFLPNNFYDVRVKTTMPLINPDISINRRIKEQEVQLKGNDILIYQRELVKEIKFAYYNYTMSGHAVSILETALSLVQQNLRANQSLLINGKGLPAYVARAESEVFSVQNQLLNAQNTKQNAAAYFNFLLNRSLTDSVRTDDSDYMEFQVQVLLAAEDDIHRREELASLAIANTITADILKMNRSYAKPRVYGFIDFAAQGFDFNVNRESLFYLGGLQLQIPIYTGKRNLYRIDQTRFDLQSLSLRTEQTKQQLELAAFRARNNARNAYNAYRSSVKQQDAAAQYFKLIDLGYKEGVNSFLEFLDGRNQLTTAQLQLNICTYRFLADMAEYERQIASYTFQ